LHLSLLALGLGPGDAVVVPTLTFLATANAARFVGAEVRFADVDPDTGLMTPGTLESALTRNGPGAAKAVVPVHLNGQCADMRGVTEVARRSGLAIVEDACHNIGGARHISGAPHPVGSAIETDMVCFSFHPVKSIAMGEGGAVTMRDARLAERVRLLRNHGMIRDEAALTRGPEAFATDGTLNPWYYEMREPGFNYRASDIHCALGLSQLKKLHTFLARRRALAAEYDRALKPLAPVMRPVPRTAPEHDGWHLYAVLIDFDKLGLGRGEFMRRLRKRGIGTQVHYSPVHRQPYYRDRYLGTSLPGADAYYARCLSLPLFVGMSFEDVNLVVAAIREVIGGR
jgi:dTDP-4-amino-4,6-dideoxygalactose transaminase